MPLLIPPDDGVTVRMYRQGHGDCFLLAMPRDGGGDPVYVLIDCGFKPGSPAFLKKKTIDDVVGHIGDSTGNHLHLVIITHEHQDHVNGFWKKNDPYFGGFTIDEAWFAWTEDRSDTLANDLRQKHQDVLLGLVSARRRLAAAGREDDPAVQRIDALLTLEIGGDTEVLPAATLELAAKGNPEDSVNKQSMKLVKDKARAGRGITYLHPGDGPRAVPDTAGIRAYVLGPPRSENLLGNEDPVGSEGFPQEKGGAHPLSFASALGDEGAKAPFSSRFCVPMKTALARKNSFLTLHYGREKEGKNDDDRAEAPDNAEWRRISDEWLYSAETLALVLNTGINNTSLVLAFELPATRKILLFIGDAQRGNWMSWKDLSWKDGNATVTARDLLERTVLYKVGHHGSHNATLAGAKGDTYPNLSWMAQGNAAREFTAMITAVNAWAVRVKPSPWIHPLPSIRQALLQKAQGRVLQMDIDRPAKPSAVSDEGWREFTDRVVFNDLYFDFTVRDA